MLSGDMLNMHPTPNQKILQMDLKYHIGVGGLEPAIPDPWMIHRNNWIHVCVREHHKPTVYQNCTWSQTLELPQILLLDFSEKYIFSCSSGY